VTRLEPNGSCGSNLARGIFASSGVPLLPSLLFLAKQREADREGVTVGSLQYNNDAFPFDDRILAHLQVVIIQKLRRHEGFLLSWQVRAEQGSGRVSLWLDSTIPIIFVFAGTRPVQINRDWVVLMAATADSGTGLTVIDEPHINHLYGNNASDTSRSHPVPSF
jgi:hypothetical protein